MALKKFELKKGHLELMKHMSVINDDSEFVLSLFSDNKDGVEVDVSEAHKPATEDEYEGFTDDELIDRIGLIIYGKPKGFDPMDVKTNFGQASYSKSEEKEMMSVYNELETAIEVTLNAQSFELGWYKTKHYDKNWKKFTPKGETAKA